MAEPRTEILIIGSGAGGGIAACVLAKAGFKVTVLEKGPWWEATPGSDGATTNVYSNDELKLGERQFINQDPRIEPRTFRPADAAADRTYIGQVLALSVCVGGGTVHYCGVSYRFREIDFNMKSTYGTIPGANLEDWPVDYAELAPYYDQVEQAIGVSGNAYNGTYEFDRLNPIAAANPFEAKPRAPYPMPPSAIKYDGKIFADGARNLGYHPFPTPNAINSRVYGGRAPCNHCGFCCGWGCHNAARGSTAVTTIPQAIATGNCEVRANTTVTRIVVNPATMRAEGVEYLDENLTPHFLAADAVILAASSVESARLSLISGLDQYDDSGMIGRNLTTHHFPSVISWYPQPIGAYRGRWSSMAMDDLYDVQAIDPQATFIKGGGNIQTVGPTAGEPVAAGMIISAAKTAPWGNPGFDLHSSSLSYLFGRSVLFGMIGEDLPQESNRVDLDPELRDVYGLPLGRINYSPHPNDLAAGAYFSQRMRQILEAAELPYPDPPFSMGLTISLPSIAPQGVHQHGTMRMGRLKEEDGNPAARGAASDRSVVDKYGRFHNVRNLYVADGGLLPTSGGYNPTLTIQALAWYVADKIASGESQT